MAVVNVPLTTNTASTSISDPINGRIVQVRIEVTASSNMDLDLTTAEGEIVYSADDVTADSILYPMHEAATTAGGTNGYFTTIPTLGALTLTASDEATTNKNVTVTVIYEK